MGRLELEVDEGGGRAVPVEEGAEGEAGEEKGPEERGHGGVNAIRAGAGLPDIHEDQGAGEGQEVGEEGEGLWGELPGAKGGRERDDMFPGVGPEEEPSVEHERHG